MYCILTIARYPKYRGWAGFLSMALFRLPLVLNKKVLFWKLLGSGKNGTFDKHPDWRQWAVLQVRREKELPGGLMNKWWQFFNCNTCTLVLEPIEGHGKWDGKECFGSLPKNSGYEGLICVFTRATIRLSKLSAFWKNVDGVASQMKNAEGFLTSIGIGELPFIKQATFSIWQTKAHMKKFAYNMQQHAEVIKRTRKENWYTEEMFVRFKLVASYGSLNGKEFF